MYFLISRSLDSRSIAWYRAGFSEYYVTIIRMRYRTNRVVQNEWRDLFNW